MTFENVLRLKQQINILASSLINKPLSDVSVIHPNSDNPECGFIRLTSWLYCLYFEVEKVSIDYFLAIAKNKGMASHVSFTEHIESVRCLRTELHHNLGYDGGDVFTRQKSEAWKRVACGSALPTNQSEWDQCYNKLLSDSVSLLDQIVGVLKLIEKLDGDEQSEILKEWIFRLNKSFKGADFDPIIEDVKFRLGRPALKTVAFRNLNLEKWKKSLLLLEDGFDFSEEATKLIEQSMLEDQAIAMPITGKELMEILNIPEGPQVGKLLTQVIEHYKKHGSSKTELIEFIHTLKE